MFLPKSKYKVKQAAWGMFQLSGSRAGEFYVGPYIEDFLGRTYAGTDITKAEERVLISVSEPEEKVEPVSCSLVPEQESYVSGSYVRYFRQNRYSKVIEEITEDRLGEVGPYKIISGTWILTGSLDDRVISGYAYRGVRYRNSETLESWDKQVPGIITALELKPEDFVQEIQ